MSRKFEKQNPKGPHQKLKQKLEGNIKIHVKKKIKTSSVYDCTVEDVELRL
jgi:hypothetical protein